jgi:hypothetical protein
MKKLISRNKSIALLLFLFGYSNLFAVSVMTSATCQAQQRLTREIETARELDICKNRTRTFEERLKDKYAFLYLKMPELGDEYLDYDIDYSPEGKSRKERALPIYIELTGGAVLLNPPKEDREKYKVSSKIKERIISENSSITRRNCTFMALGSEYLFPVPAREGILSVKLYFDYTRDEARYSELKKNPFYKNRIPDKYFDQFVHRGLQTSVSFESGKIYQLEILIDPNSSIPRGSYNATAHTPFEWKQETVRGFTITLKELPPNTKFAFDGKDDIGKTYEQVKKEFILYDKSAEGN